jgi:hypothetical protein
MWESGIQEVGIPWCTLFADDVIFMDERRTRINEKLEL